MKWIPVALLPLAGVSCFGIDVSPEAEAIVPYLKAERYDKAAEDPDFLAEGFIVALREMEDEGLDPRRIVAVADAFFDHYPFCLDDLPIDEDDLAAVAGLRWNASTKLTPALPACADFDRAASFQDMIATMRSWKGGHNDGGRCVRSVHSLCQKLRAAGFDWARQIPLNGNPRIDSDEGLVKDLFRAAIEVQPDDPYIPLIAFSASSFSGWAAQGRRSYAIEEFSEELRSSRRWSRLYACRVAWLGALRQSPRFRCEGLGEALVKSKYDGRLRKLGEAIQAFSSFVGDLEKGTANLEALKAAVDLVVLRGRGTPFPDMARHAYVFALAESRRGQDGESWLRTHVRDFDHPFHACYGALHLAYRYGNADDSPEASAKMATMARWALAQYPRGSSSVEAWLMLAQMHEAAGRETDAITCLESALAWEPVEDALFEDETADLARSNAGQMLGRLLLKRGAWDRALRAWEDLDLYTGCGTTDRDWQEKFDSMALCLEKLGRPADALEYHWRAAGAGPVMSRERAALVKSKFEAQGMTDLLKRNVRAQVEALRSWGNVIRDDDGLKWLAETLGVPVR